MGKGTHGTRKRERIGDGAPAEKRDGKVGEMGKETLKSTLFKNSEVFSTMWIKNTKM